MNLKAKGYALGAIAATTYGMNPLFALPLYKAGMNPDSVLFFRYLCAIPIMALMIRARGRSFKLKKNEILPLIVMGLMMALSSLTLFLSYNYMDAGIASTILFVYPIMVAVIMALFFKEKLTKATICCLVLAIYGITQLYHGDGDETLSLVGVGLAMTSALTYAIYIVGANRSVLKDIPTVTMTFYILLFGLSLFFVRLDFGRALLIPDQWYLWGNILALAALPTALSFLCTTQAIQYIGSTPTAILGALEPLTAVFFGVLVFGEALTPRLCYGIFLILLAVTLVIAGGNISQHLVRFRKLFPSLPRKLRSLKAVSLRRNNCNNGSQR